MKYIVTLVVVSIVIFLLKFPETAGLHFTDANNYIYIAQLLEQGKVLYRDIHLDNFPLMMYISIFYKTITFGSMQWFNVTATIEKFITTGILYLIAFRFWKKHSTAFLVSMTFLCSYTSLSNSFQLGFYTSVLFLALAYYFSLDKRLVLTGIFAALAILVKAYALFPALGLFISIAYQYKWRSYKFVIVGFITSILVMIPTFLFAFPQFIDQTFGYGLVRAVVEPKYDYYLLFVQVDFLVFLLLIWNLTLWKKNLFVASATVATLLFLALYKDVYFIYFCYLPFIAALGAGYLIETHIPYTKLTLPKPIFVTLFCFALLFAFSTYIAVDRFKDLIPEDQKLYDAIKKEHPDQIYGYSYIVNGISYNTGIKPYSGLYDVTSPMFVNRNIDRTEFTKEVMKTKTLILMDIIMTTEYKVYDNSIMDTSLLKNCKVTHSQPVNLDTTETSKRYLSLVKCYK